MSDLEMTKLCAVAMEIEIIEVSHNKPEHTLRYRRNKNAAHTSYWPLHDDAQAMALVKKFNSCIKIRYETVDYDLEIKPPYWEVKNYYPDRPPIYGGIGRNADLNRAIVECVAHMRNGGKT